MDYLTALIISTIVKVCNFSLKNVYNISKGTKKEHKVVCEADLAYPCGLLTSLSISFLMFGQERPVVLVHFINIFQNHPSLPI